LKARILPSHTWIITNFLIFPEHISYVIKAYCSEKSKTGYYGGQIKIEIEKSSKIMSEIMQDLFLF
jgi:hypothetical protein